jgi:predicted oxidoreductase
MQPILGTTNPQRVKDSCQASGIALTREEWYSIYLAAGNQLP